MFSNNQHVGTRWSPPFTMNGLGSFLESSTIHGLSYIATSNRTLIRLFWVLTVIGGFTGAGVIIYQSFQAWDESPITTTIETRPISEITFPKVTVCPPKNTYTDFNYDLMMTKDITLDNDTRNELINYAVGLLYDKLHKDIMTNLSMLHEENRYYNWYHWFTEITMTYWDGTLLNFTLNTFALSGSISTQYYGRNFLADEIHEKLLYTININKPSDSEESKKATLYLNIETNVLPNLDHYEMNNGVLETSFNPLFRNYTPPKSQKFTLKRMSSVGDIFFNKTDKFPGFRIKWHYSKELTPNRYSATEQLLGGCISKWLCRHVNPSLDRLGVNTYYYTYHRNPSNVLFNKYKPHH